MSPCTRAHLPGPVFSLVPAFPLNPRVIRQAPAHPGSSVLSRTRPPIARSHVTPPHVLPRALAAATARTPRGAAALTWRCSTALARFNPALFGSALRVPVAFSCWVVPALWEEMPAQARPYSLFLPRHYFPQQTPHSIKNLNLNSNMTIKI